MLSFLAPASSPLQLPSSCPSLSRLFLVFHHLLFRLFQFLLRAFLFGACFLFLLLLLLLCSFLLLVPLKLLHSFMCSCILFFRKRLGLGFHLLNLLVAGLL